MIMSVLFTILFSSCDLNNLGNKNQTNTVSQPIQIKELDVKTQDYDRYYQIYTLEGCEYIVISPGLRDFTWGTHKGNCKNSTHNRK